MRTALSSTWSSADLTGNSTFVEVSGSPTPTIYLVTESDATTNIFNVLKSIDYGTTWISEASYQLNSNTTSTPGTTINSKFNPAIYYDGADTIHIVGNQVTTTYNVPLIELVYFSFTISTSSLVGPTSLAISEFASAYDIIALTTTNVIVVTSLTNSPSLPASNPYNFYLQGSTSSLFLSGQYLVSIQLISLVPSISILPSSAPGITYGGVSLVFDASSTLNLFYVAHPSLFSRNPQPHSINKVTYSSGVWSSATTLFTYNAIFASDKLTVVPFASSGVIKLLLSHCYYLNPASTPYSVIAFYDGTVWSPLYPLDSNVFEPTPSVDTDGNFSISYLKIVPTQSPSGLFTIMDIDTSDPSVSLPLSVPVDSWTQNLDLYYSNLRGSKYPIDTTSKWITLALQINDITEATQTGWFQSGYHALPIASMSYTGASGGVIIREQPVSIISTSMSPDGLNLTAYDWSIGPTGATGLTGVSFTVNTGQTGATLLVDNSFGPTAAEFSIGLTVYDIASSLPATPLILTLPFNPAPTITWNTTPPSNYTVLNDTNPVLSTQIQRGTTILCTPTITPGLPQSDITYTWVQTGGTPVAITWIHSEPFINIDFLGTSIFGEILTFQIFVSDGVNSPATSTLTINVPARTGANVIDTGQILRFLWETPLGALNTLANRNPSSPTGASWSSGQLGAISSDFSQTRVSQTSSGSTRQIMISPLSVTVTGDGNNTSPYSMYYCKRFLFNTSNSIIDAWQTEVDETLVLASNKTLYRYEQLGGSNSSDNPQHSIDLTLYLPATISGLSNMTVSQASGGVRVISLSTDLGLLLLEIDESTFTLTNYLFMTTQNGMLLGANSIVFVRFNNVENFKTGTLLIGTTTGTQTYEILFDLATKQILQSWNRFTQINQNIITGEIL